METKVNLTPKGLVFCKLNFDEKIPVDIDDFDEVWGGLSKENFSPEEIEGFVRVNKENSLNKYRELYDNKTGC